MSASPPPAETPPPAASSGVRIALIAALMVPIVAVGWSTLDGLRRLREPPPEIVLPTDASPYPYRPNDAASDGSLRAASEQADALRAMLPGGTESSSPTADSLPENRTETP